MKKPKILIAGATGYIGSRLLTQLEKSGYPVNCLARNPGRVKTCSPTTTVYPGDLMIRTSLWRAFRKVDTAFYLIHSLHEKKDFEQKEIRAAENFADMARSAGVRRIIYLGALGDESDQLSRHLQSRMDTGHALRKSHVQTVELRSSVVIGNGSSSYDLLADLTENLPFMVTPSWVSTRTQPIGISDLLDYLAASIDLEIPHHATIQIGGADRLTYGELMREYAKQRGIKRVMLPVPILSPTLSSHWISCFSRVDPVLGRRLIEGIRNSTIVQDNRSREQFNIEPQTAARAIAEALEESDAHSSGEEHVYAA